MNPVQFFASLSIQREPQGFDGRVVDCTLLGCKGACCCFDRPNYYISLQPKEIQSARNMGCSVDHLKIIDSDFHGGQRAVCIAQDKRTCDQGWKPWDCRYYPISPVVDEKGCLSQFVADPSCKLIAEGCDLSEHIRNVERQVSAAAQRDPSLISFLSKDEVGDIIGPFRFPSKEGRCNVAPQLPLYALGTR